MIPTLQEITVSLTNKCSFSVLDFEGRFYHIALDPESSNLCAFGTSFGIRKFNGVPFGLSCAPEIFQKCNTKVFGGIPG